MVKEIPQMHLCCRNVVLICVISRFFLIVSVVMFISQLQCSYANNNPMKH